MQNARATMLDAPLFLSTLPKNKAIKPRSTPRKWRMCLGIFLIPPDSVGWTSVSYWLQDQKPSFTQAYLDLLGPCSTDMWELHLFWDIVTCPFFPSPAMTSTYCLWLADVILPNMLYANSWDVRVAELKFPSWPLKFPSWRSGRHHIFQLLLHTSNLLFVEASCEKSFQTFTIWKKWFVLHSYEKGTASS